MLVSGAGPPAVDIDFHERVRGVPVGILLNNGGLGLNWLVIGQVAPSGDQGRR